MGDIETIISGATDCGVCGTEAREGDAIAEIYDPSDPEAGTDLVHADCMPKGWEIA